MTAPAAPGRLFCSDVSGAAGRQEPLLGSAHTVRGFLLVSWPKRFWGRQHFSSRGLPAPLVAELRRIQKEHRYFVRLVTSGGRGEVGEGRVFVMPESRCLEFGSIDGLAGILRRAFPEGPAAGAPELGSWPGWTKRLLLCCTNGARDRCCAKYGFAVFSEAVRLTRGLGTFEILQSTHLTGDRFAACVLDLPSGDIYGRVRAGGVAALLGRLQRGEIEESMFRGNSYLAEDDQIAFGRAAMKERSLGIGRLETLVSYRPEGGLTVARVELRTGRGRLAAAGEIAIGSADFAGWPDCAALDLGRAEAIPRRIVVSETWTYPGT